ncbi:hypothetical protein [Enterococcus cecorum]|uniref:hypothetical protein n=1 Tax=Enterococcus cecorum TaxID=44008 RepID=UPI0032C48E85
MFGSIVEFDKLCLDVDFISKTISELQSRIVGIEEKQNQDISEYKEWLSDIANRMEATLANEKENQALKERIEKLKERVEELEKENKWLETRLKISMETSDNLTKLLIKGD